MSIMGMRRRFAVHLRYVLYFIIGVFVLTLPAIFSGGGGRLPEGEEKEPAIMKDPVAEVDGATLTRKDFERAFQRGASDMMRRAQVYGQVVELQQVTAARLEAFDGAVLESLVIAEAKKQGISISDRQIAKRASEMAQQQLSQFKLQLKGKELEQQLAGLATSVDGRPRGAMSERSFLRWMAKLQVDTGADDLRAELAAQALAQRVTGSVAATEKELLASYDQATLREIVVAFDPAGKPKRSDEEARKRAEGILEQLRKGSDIAELARTRSDDQEAKFTGGLQQPIAVVSMAPAYQKAVGGLKAGELAPQPIKTDRGYTIVKLEKREQRLPEDFQKSKQQYLKDFSEQKRRTAWEEYTRQLQEKAKVKVVDNEILAYQELAKGDYAKALPLLEQAVPPADQIGGLAAASVHYQMAIVYSLQSKWQEAADAYGAASDSLSGQNGIPEARAQALMGMGHSYQQLGDKEKAAEWYQAASDASQTEYVHEQLLLLYRGMGKADLAKQEQQWLDDYRAREAEQTKAIQEQQRKMEEEAAKKQPKPASPPGPGAPTARPPSRQQRSGSPGAGASR